MGDTRSRSLRRRRMRILIWTLGGMLLVGLTGSKAPPSPADDLAAERTVQVQETDAPADGQAGGEEHAEEAPGESHGPEPTEFFLVLIAILIAAKLGGEAAERIGQPAVLGELVGGVIVGGSVLGIVPTAAGDPMAEIVHLLSEVGVVILLFEVGLETDLQEMFRVGTAAGVVALVGVTVPFGLGAAYWLWADPSLGAHPPGVSLAKVAIFVGATLTATSVGITARVLSDLDQMHSREARTIIGAAVIDDVLGLVMLALVIGLVAGAEVTAGSIAWTLTKAVGFLVVAVIVGNIIGPYLFDLVDRLRVRGILLVAAFSFALLMAALADLSDSAMIIGSFAAGLVLSRTNQFDLVVERIEPVADIFTPIFFVSVGAAVNVRLVLPWTDEFSMSVLVIGGILTVIAIIGKIVSGYFVPWTGMSAVAIGIGMIPRGEVGLIFADIGRRGGLLTEGVFSAVLIMVMVTTFITPPLLKWVFASGSASKGNGGSSVEAVGAEAGED